MRFPMHTNSRAFALPMVLLIIVAITILVVGLFLSISRERAAARSMLENESAKLVARAAVDHAVALLDHIPQPKPPLKSGPDPAPGSPGSLGSSIDATPSTNWITSPGLLTLVQGSRVTEIPLSSNPSADTVPSAEDPDLNSPLLDVSAGGEPVYPIIPAQGGVAVPLRVKWVNLLKDPSQPASKDNPLVARYAFWVDDEATKLNVNAAHGKPADLDFSKPNPLMADPLAGFAGVSTGRLANVLRVATRRDSGGAGPDYDVAYPLWHFSSENIDVLDTADGAIDAEALADSIHNTILWTSANRYEFHWKPLSSASEISAFLSGDEAARQAFLQENLFQMTASGWSPEFNVFGKSRLFMDRLQPIVDNSLYHQMSYDQDGPVYTHAGEMTAGQTSGALPNLGRWTPNANGFIHAAWSLAHLLSRRDWPGMPASSFVDKWGGGEAALREADQVAWNMAMLAAYSSGSERTNSAGNLAEGGESTSALLMNRSIYAVNPRYGVAGFLNGDGRSGGPNDTMRLPGRNGTGLRSPNGALFPGVLSGKAVLPWIPAPQINEIALRVEMRDFMKKDASLQNIPLVPGDPDYGKAWLRLGFEVDIQFGGPLTGDDSRRMPTAKNVGGNGTNPSRRSYAFIPTDLEYTISQDGIVLGRQSLPQSNTSESDMHGVKGAFAAAPNTNVYSGTYYRVQSNKFVPVSNNAGNYLLDPKSNGDPLDPASLAASVTRVRKDRPISVTCSFRFAYGQIYEQGNRDTILQVIPVWDSREQASSGSPYFVAPPGESDRLTITMEIDPDLLTDAFGDVDPSLAYIRSLEIADSRLGGNSSAWRPFQDWDGAGTPNAGSPPPPIPSDKLEGHRLGQPNWSEVAAAGDKSEYAYFDLLNAAYGTVFPRGSIGMLSVVPTGMQRGIPFETFRFQPSTTSAELPDWLVLDLFAPALQPFSSMHAVMGKINPNAALTPTSAARRWKPLQALLKNSDYPGTSGNPSTLAENVLNYAFTGVDFGAQGRYDYVGELCEVRGFADQGGNAWEREGLIRNYANLLTTRSSSFTVWGMAQIIRKAPANSNYGAFEPGDRVVGEKRFQAQVERSVWPGVDGVPGNGTAVGGVYTKVAQPAGQPDYNKQRSAGFGRFIGDVPWAPVPAPITGSVAQSFPIPGAAWPVIDGPDAPTFKVESLWPHASPQTGEMWGEIRYEQTPLEESANPLRAWMRTQVVDFDFLDQ
jgi:hypothetical protein